MSASLREWANALGGEVVGDQVLAPGPNHRRADPSLAVKPSASSRDGFLVNSFACDDWRECRDYVAARLGLDPHRRPVPEPRYERAPRATSPDEQPSHDKRPLWLWRQRKPIEGSTAERYLRGARGYRGPIPLTLAYLPARNGHPPTMIAAFGTVSEPEPGVLAIADADIRGVHVTRLLTDGSDRARNGAADKATIGRGSTGSPIILALPNDLHGLAITEGIEDALSIVEATGLGAWAAGSAGITPALAAAVPRYIECVSIFGHRDRDGTRRATELAVRLKARGFDVVLKFLGTLLKKQKRNVQMAMRAEVLKTKCLNGTSFANGERMTFIVETVAEKEIGPTHERKWVVRFQGFDQGWVLNSINWDVIERVYGDTENCAGRPVVLFGEKVEFQGKRLDGIRCEVPRLAAGGKPLPRPQSPQSAFGSVAAPLTQPAGYVQRRDDNVVRVERPPVTVTTGRFQHVDDGPREEAPTPTYLDDDGVAL